MRHEITVDRVFPVGRVRPSHLDLSGHISRETREAIENLPCFRGVPEKHLLQQAETKLRGKRKITDRITAMLVIVGTRPIDHPDLQIEIY